MNHTHRVQEYRRGWIVVLLALALLLMSSTPAPASHSMRVGVYDNMPLSGMDASGRPQGLFVDVLKTIAEEEHWQLEWQACAFPECLRMLESGEIDLLGPIAYSPERAQTVDFSQETVITNWGRVYTPAGSDIESLLDLDGAPLALLRGDIHAQAFLELAQEFDIQPRYLWMDTYEAVFQAVRDGKAQAGVVNRMYGERHARAFGLRASPVIFNPLSVQFASTRGAHTEMLAAIDRHIRRMKATPDSAYYQALEYWMEGGAPPLVIPVWLRWALVLAAFGAVVFFLTSVALQHRLHNQMAELDLQNKRLEAEIERHRQTQETLHLHTTALEAAANSVMITDRQGRILWVNPAFTRLTGFSREESLGKTPRILKSDTVPKTVYENMWRTILSGQVWQGEVVNRHKDGHLYVEEVTITPILNEQGEITRFVAIQQDISERKQRERSQQAQLQIAQSLEDASTQEEIIPRMVSQVMDIFQAQATAFSRAASRGEERIIEARGRWQERAGQPLPAGWPRPSREAPALLTRRAVSEETGLPHLGILRLETGQELLGHLWIGTLRPLHAADRQLLLDIQPTLAYALQRARLLASTQQQLQRINALHSIDLAIASSVDMHITLNILLEQLMNIAPVHAASIAAYNPRGNELKIVQSRNLPAAILRDGHRRMTGKYISVVMRTRQPLIIPDLGVSTRPHDGLGQFITQSYRGYACFPLMAKGKINGVLEVYSATGFHTGDEWIEFVGILSGQAAIAIENATLFSNLQRSKDELTVAYESALLGWSRALAVRHNEPPGHAERVAELSLELAQILGIQEEGTLRALRYGAWLHDVGKLGIPDSLLRKTEAFTKEELALLHRTPEFARRFLEDIPLLEEAATIPAYRYERWDGRGYPQGLSGELIPLVARIFSVIHTWDARAEPRHYHPAWSREQRLAYLREQAGRRFDPRVVQVFLESGLV